MHCSGQTQMIEMGDTHLLSSNFIGIFLSLVPVEEAKHSKPLTKGPLVIYTMLISNNAQNIFNQKSKETMK